MNKPFYIFLFVSIIFSFGNGCGKAYAQTNLVYNGDFEQYSSCPTTPSFPLQAPNYEITKCLSWTAPTYGTSDYCNVCGGSSVGIPSNNLGYQYAHSGNGYCGFYAFDLSSGNWFEYIQGKFTQPLVYGHKYFVSFYLSLSDFSQYAVSNIGAYISNNPISQNDTYPYINYIPQIKNQTGNFLIDTLNWILISGDFKANGNEQYITLGNYSDSTLSHDSLQIQTSPTPNSYYYVDDVSIIDITTEEIPSSNVFTPNNDGVNDVFLINGLTDGDKVEIFNRWGILVDEFATKNGGWDGRTSSGIECVDGVYYYIVTTNDIEKNKKGFIQLVR